MNVQIKSGEQNHVGGICNEFWRRAEEYKLSVRKENRGASPSV